MLRRVVILASIWGLVAQVPSQATTVCVTDVEGLRAALSGAVGDNSATYIEVARGTYQLGGTGLSFYSTDNSQGQVDITGGYNTDCSAIIEDPKLTILDGQGLSSVLAMSSYAGISVRYLTIENGSNDNPNSGLDVRSDVGGIIIDYNIIRNNASGNWSGLYANVSSGSGDIHIDGNLIVGNTGAYLAAGEVEIDGSGTFYITNNTIADNSDPGDTTLCGGLEVNSGSGGANLSNNIFWHNTNYGLLVASSSPGIYATLVNNDSGSAPQGTLGAGSTGNLAVNPNFAANGDYHLSADSPLLGQGTLAPAGGLPTIDIEGHPRSYNGEVDIGAYERGDVIFGDDFDH